MTSSNDPNLTDREAYTQIMQDENALAALNQEDPARYRHLHEQALHYLNKQLTSIARNREAQTSEVSKTSEISHRTLPTSQLMAGILTLESDWTAVYERLANLYFARDTQALLQLTTATASLPLQGAQAQHMRHYFQGVAAFRQAQYAVALDSFAELLIQPDLDTHLRARALNSRAVVCRVTGRLEEAMVGYRASLGVWQELEDDHYQGIVTLNLGIISYNLRRYEQADTYLRQAERFFEAAGSADWLAKTQSELGLVQRDLGHWDEAIAYLDTYIVRSKQQESWEDVGAGEINRAEVLLFKGDVAEAKAALQKALPLLVSKTYRVDPLLYLGLAFQAEGDLVQAEVYYREALVVAQETDRREILPHAYYYLGEVVRLQGKDEESLAYWQQAADVIEETHTPLRDEALKISLLGRWQQVYEALILHCATLGRVEEAFAWAERARARAFAEGLIDDEERPVLSLSNGPFTTTIVSLPDLQATIPKATTLLCYFTTGVLEQDIPLLRAIPASNPLRDHILTPAKTLLFVVTSTQISLHHCPLDPNVFATSSPRGFDAKRFLKTAVLHRLHTALLTPFTDNRSPDTDHLVILPHGPLHRVPFTALVAQNENPPTLSFAPSGTIFASKRIQGKKESRETAVSCLAVGYNGIRSARYLKYADGEVEAVAHIMNGQAWLGSEPKKETLPQRAANCRWLHIACHGWFDDADPLASYLETGKDERLTAREVIETWSLQAELVVLSACETGISQILRGDEPMGLVRAFLYAGAQSVLVSQWPVDDLATFLLMVRFYTELQADPANLSMALMKAQTWLRGVTAVTIQQIVEEHGLLDVPTDWLPESKPFAAPEFWAGFMLI